MALMQKNIYIVTFENIVNTLFVFCTILVSIFFVTTAQAQNFEWVKRFGSTSIDNGFSASSFKNKIIFGGQFTGNVIFDSDTLIGSLSDDCFLFESNSDGNIQFIRHYKSNGSVGINSIFDSLGNIYSYGSYNTSNLELVGYPTNGFTGGLNVDAIIYKLDSLGTPIWNKNINGGWIERFARVHFDNNNNPIGSGYYSTNGSAVSIPNSTFVLPQSSGRDAFFVKYNKGNGNVLWANSFSGSGDNDLAVGYFEDSLGNQYIAGQFNGNISINGSSPINTNGGFDIFLSKFNPSGDLIWIKQFGGSGNDFCSNLIGDENGNLIISGSFSGNVVIGSTTLTSNGLTDGLLFTVNHDGIPIKSAKIGGTGNDFINDIELMFDNNIAFTGHFSTTISVDTFTITSKGNIDGFAGVINNQNKLLRLKGFGGSLDDYSTEIATDGYDIYLTGRFQGTALFDTIDLTSAGENDIFTAKLVPNICIPPKFLTDPSSVVVCQGGNTTLNVSARGTNLSYQWKRGSTNVGTNSPTLNLTNVSATDAGSYTVEITGQCGSVSSIVAGLTVNIPPNIIDQPKNTVVCEGNSAFLSIEANGSALVYQWFRNNSPITANSDTFKIISTNLNDTGFYRVLVSGICGSVFSNTVSLSINRLPILTVQPQSITLCQNDEAIFTTNVVGTLPISYIWKRGINTVGINSPILTIPNVQLSDAGKYSLIASNICGFIISDSATLTVNPHKNVLLTANFCKSDSFDFNGRWLKSAGLYIDTIPTQSGCDSIISLVLSQVNQNYDTVTYIACTDGTFSYLWEGQTINSSGIYQKAFSNIFGCDSIKHLLVTLPNIKVINQSICEGDSLLFNGKIIRSAGVYYDTIASFTTCDTLVQLTLSWRSRTFSEQIINICSPDSIFFGSRWLSASGIYSDTILNQAGCDSVINIRLTAHKSTNTNLTEQLCKGDNIIFDGKKLYASGEYYDTLQSYHGCDSIVYLRLVVNNADTINSKEEICEGEVFTFGTQELDSSGYYQLFNSNRYGCDSLNKLWLMVHPSPKTDTTIFWCKGMTMIIGGIKVEGIGIYTELGQTEKGCPSEKRFKVVTDADSCFDLITHSDIFRIPNIITPNGDGLNDNFDLRWVALFDRVELEIINRWGEKIYKTGDYQNNWGANAEVGLYYIYLVGHLGNRTVNIKGWLSVIK